MNWGEALPGFAIALVVGYLFGSIPFGLLFTRLAGVGDVRAIGSGNIGATNVLRTGRRGLAAATLLGDALKGTVAVLLMGELLGQEAALAAGFGAFLGHIFPVWLKFRGGKGVATFLGVLLALFWPAVLVFAAVWLVIAWFTRYSSLAGLLATLSVPAMLYGFDQMRMAALFGLMTAIIYITHRTNIRRLLSGTEPRIGSRT